MVQVLPYIPGFGERIGPHIAEFAKDIGAGIQKRGAHKAFQAFEDARQGIKSESSPMDKINDEIENSGPKILTAGEFAQGKALAEASKGKEGADAWEKAALVEQKQLLKNQAERERDERGILSSVPKKFLEGVASYDEHSRSIDSALGAELDAINNGEVDPFSSGHLAQILKDFNLPASLAAPFETVGSKSFRTGQKTFLAKTFNDSFRGSTSTGQIALASSLLAETGATKQANKASLYLLIAQHEIEKEKSRLTHEAIDKGISAYKIPNYVNKQLDAYAKKVNDDYFDRLQKFRDEIK
jgi:hypothetical protein